VLDLLREEEARARELELKKEWKARRDGMQAGMLLMAFGIGLVAMFAIATSRRNWVIGLIPVLVGLVVFLFAALNRPKDTLRA
jgi:cytochrome c biogenesis protein CcdA